MKLWETAYRINNSSIRTTETNHSPYNHPDMYVGKLIGENWIPFDVYTYEEGEYTDFYNYFGGLPVINRKTYECLRPYLEGEVEFLPINHPGAELFVMNVVSVLDVLDYEKTIVPISPFGNNMRYVDFVYFSEERINQSVYIFKVPEAVTSRSFVTERFVELLDHFKLRGPQLNLSWRTEFISDVSQNQIERYNQVLQQLWNDVTSEKIPFSQALIDIQSNKTYRSGEYKLRFEYESIRLGTLTNECKIAWRSLNYITPKLEGLLWHEDDTNDFGDFI